MMWHCSYPRVFFFRLLHPPLSASVPCGFPGMVNSSPSPPPRLATQSLSPTHHPHVTSLNRPSQCFSSASPNARLRSCHITHKGVFQSGTPLGGLPEMFFLAGCREFAGFFWAGREALSNVQQNVLFCDTGVIFNTTHRYSMLS